MKQYRRFELLPGEKLHCSDCKKLLKSGDIVFAITNDPHIILFHCVRCCEDILEDQQALTIPDGTY